MEPVDQALTQLPLGHQKFSFINIVSGGMGGGEGEGKRVIGRLGGKKGMMGEEGKWETGEKTEGVRQRCDCGGLLKHRVPTPTPPPSSSRGNWGRQVEIILTMKLPPSSPLGYIGD
jgi:hypothetical protein